MRNGALVLAYTAMVVAQSRGPQLLALLWGDDVATLATAHARFPHDDDYELDDMCAAYSAAHWNRTSNSWHAAGMLSTLVLLVVTCIFVTTTSRRRSRWVVLWWLPPVYYLPAWVGHFGWQRDIPAVFVYGTTLRGWFLGEACAWIELAQGRCISELEDLVLAMLLSNIFVYAVVPAETAKSKRD